MIKAKKVSLIQVCKKVQNNFKLLIKALKNKVKKMINKIFKYFFILVIILIINRIFKNQYKSALNLCYFLNKINNLRLGLL